MKKLQLLAVWLLCATIIVPLSTQAIENWIYTVEGWSKTVIWHDDTWWDINMTIEEDVMLNFYNWYFWWFNYITDYFFYDEEWTYDKNNARWWGGDNVNNWFNSWLTPARQWPCSDWRHVPSRWEWNNLAIARCNLDTWCNAWYSDEASGWVTWDLIKYNSWTESNKLVYLNRTWLWNRFKDSLGILNNKYWTSTPGGSYDNAYTFDVNSNVIENGTTYRETALPVRCFRDSIIEPPTTYTVTFLNDGVEMASWSVISGSLRNEEIPSVIKEWYNFDYRYLEWLENTWFDFTDTIITWNINLYAKWTPKKYTIIFVDWSGENENVILSWAYLSEITNKTYPSWTKEGYTISWDKTIPDTMPLNWETITASWTINQYTITLDIDGNITTITWDYGSPITKPTNPTRNGYRFVGWEPEIPDTMPAKDIIIKAVREKLGSSGGWGGKSSKDVISNESEKSTEQPTWNQVDSSAEASEWQNDASLIKGGAKWNEAEGFSEEFQQAYEFAKEKWITTMPTINDANMNWKLTRIAMAKMLSYYAINVLWQKPYETRINKFNDITEKLDAQYDSGVTLAYQLWIMWINMPDNKFRPNDEVTRAEFGTALSRMLYGIADWKDKYYLPHLQKLLEEKIITKDDPTMKELRGYVMIMLMRSAK